MWSFGQCFGDRDPDVEIADLDMLTAVEFDSTGEFLATGDRGGRIVLFEATDAARARRKRPWSAMLPSRREREAASAAAIAAGEDETYATPPEYKFFSELQVRRFFSFRRDAALRVSNPRRTMPSPLKKCPSTASSPAPPHLLHFLHPAPLPSSVPPRPPRTQSHLPEFDYLKSVEIEEKISKIAWVRRSTDDHLLLACNDKSIKLWKVGHERSRSVSQFNVEASRFGGRVPVNALRVPRLVHGESSVVARTRRVYSAAHVYHINSLSPCSDGLTFLTADDLRINLWSLDNAQLAFNIVDIKPPTLEELTEVITAADFSPVAGHLFAYATSRGALRLADTRARALCDDGAKAFVDPQGAAGGAAGDASYSDIVSGLTDIDFSKDGRVLVTRDYMCVKIWDLSMEREPVRVIPVHEHLRPRLADLYESDHIFDKFQVASSFDGTRVLTGAWSPFVSRVHSLHVSALTKPLPPLRVRHPPPLTGSYGLSLKVFDTYLGTETHISLSKTISEDTVPLVRPLVSRGGGAQTSPEGGAAATAASRAQNAAIDTLAPSDFDRKLFFSSYAANEDVIAIAGQNNLFVFGLCKDVS